MYPHVQEKIWKTFQKIEELHSLLIDSLVQYSVENGIGSPQAEAMADTVNTMNNNSIRGRVITRMRRVLAKTAQNSQPSIVKHQSWPEIGCLIRFMLMLSFYYDHDAKPYVAEVFHIISMVVSTGPTFIRTSVHEFLVNCIHILVTNKHITDERRKKLKFMLDEVCDGKYRIHFGVNKSHANSFTITEETMTDNMEKMNLASLEGIVRLILDAISYSSPNTGKSSYFLNLTQAYAIHFAYRCDQYLACSLDEFSDKYDISTKPCTSASRICRLGMFGTRRARRRPSVSNPYRVAQRTSGI